MPLISVQVAPALMVLKMWPCVSEPNVNPDMTAKAVDALDGSTTTCDTERFGSVPVMFVQMAEAPAAAFEVVWTRPSLVPA